MRSSSPPLSAAPSALAVSALLFLVVSPSFAQSPASEPKLIVTGRVVDTENKPIPNVTCTLRRIPTRAADDDSMIDKSTTKKLKPTTSDGTVRTDELKTGDAYVLEFSHAGYVPGISHRTHCEATGKVRVKDVVLRRLRTVRGVVLNSEGQPLEGVTVRQAGDGPAATETATSERGQFELDGVPEGLALIFASHPGYWFTGCRAPTGGKEIRIKLTRRTKPNPERCGTDREPVRNTKAADESAERFEQVVEKFRNADQLVQRIQFGYKLVELDYRRARKVFTRIAPPEGYDEVFRGQGIAKELKDDFQNGLARIKAIDSANARVETLLYYTFSEIQVDSDQKRTLLANAITDLRAIDDPLSRIGLTSRLLVHVHRAGLTHVTGQLVDECLELTEDNEVGSALKNAIGSLAEELSPIDPERALELLPRADAMFSAWIATSCADRRPKEAAKIIRDYKFDGIGGSRLGRVYVLPRACYRMAHADVDEAMKLAELMDGVVTETPRYTVWDPTKMKPDSVANRASKFLGQAAGLLGASKEKSADNAVAVLFKARVHGLIAEAIAESNPKRAREIIEAAAEQIMSVKSGVNNERGGFHYSPSAFMASLVPAAAKIDPGLGADLCWRSLAVRFAPPASDTIWLIEPGDLAAYPMLATVDWQLGVDMFEAVASRTTGQSFDGKTYSWWVAGAWARLDSNRGLRWAGTLCDKGVDGAASPLSQGLDSTVFSPPQEGSARFGSTILDRTQSELDGIMWLGVLLDREALHPKGSN